VKIWTPVTLLQAVFPRSARREVAAKAKRWTAAAAKDPRLATDLITLGGVLTGQPAMVQDGWPTPALPDPARLAYEAGRRDTALQLLALMSLTPTELNALVKEDAYEPYSDD
jgi:hypothetical protein